MQIVIDNVLSAAELKTVSAALDKAQLGDGREIAGVAARQATRSHKAAVARSPETIKKLITERILGNDIFRLAVRPKSLSSLLLSRYDKGMSYCTHGDAALMHGMRADVSFTLFLSDPKSYDGGALVLESAAGDDEVKLDAGALVAYPATSLQRIDPVTRGVRLAAVGWVRSFIRDAARRELLFDLEGASRLIFARTGHSPEFDLVVKSVANLMRMWAED